MKSVWRSVAGGAVLVAVTTLVTTKVVSQHEGGPSHEEMMELMQKLATPGAEHAKLQELAGTWTQQVTAWDCMEPSAAPTTSQGKETLKPVLGGRFLLQNISSKMHMGGQEYDFEGLGLIGYDNGAQKHIFAWADSMGTMIMNGQGDRQANGDVVYYSEVPFGGDTWKMKSVARVDGPNRKTFEMYTQMPDGSWSKSMEIVSTRK